MSPDIGAQSGPRETVMAPLAGWATPLSELPDPVFAGLVLGDGVAINPVDQLVRAPCDGTITMLHRAHHALTLRTSAGADILMHIGLNTVELNGVGFTPHVTAGQQVRQGDALISFDAASIAVRVKSLLTRSSSPPATAPSPWPIGGRARRSGRERRSSRSRRTPPLPKPPGSPRRKRPR